MWYIGSQDSLTERFITGVEPYTIRQGEVFEPLYFETHQQAEAALRAFKAWCKVNYGSVEHRLLEDPRVIPVEGNDQLNLF